MYSLPTFFACHLGSHTPEESQASSSRHSLREDINLKRSCYCYNGLKGSHMMGPEDQTTCMRFAASRSRLLKQTNVTPVKIDPGG